MSTWHIFVALIIGAGLAGAAITANLYEWRRTRRAPVTAEAVHQAMGTGMWDAPSAHLASGGYYVKPGAHACGCIVVTRADGILIIPCPADDPGFTGEWEKRLTL